MPQIDVGADVCVNTVGYQRGIEIYREKAILYGQPGLLLQNEQVTRMPSSAMQLLGLERDLPPGAYMAERMRIGMSVGGSDIPGLNSELGPPGVSSVGLVVFDADAQIREVRIQPFEFLTAPRVSAQLSLPSGAGEPGSAGAARVHRPSLRASRYAVRHSRRNRRGALPLSHLRLCGVYRIA